MELPEILERLKEPEKLIDPQQINTIVSYLSGFISDSELELDEAKIAYSFKWESVKYLGLFPVKGAALVKPLTDKETEIKMMRDPVYEHLNKTKRKLGELKRYRSDLRDKLNIIMNIKRY